MGAYNGSGVFVRSYSWTQDAANSIDITASRMDTEDTGFASGLSLCVTRDGQGQMAANFLPSSDGSYDLGSAGAHWRNLQLSGSISVGGVDGTPALGNWTATLSGPWIAGNNPTGTLKWESQGSQITIWCDSPITQTATISTFISVSGLPAAITPSSTRKVACAAINNSSVGVASGMGSVVVNSSGGTLTIFTMATAGGANPQGIVDNVSFGTGGVAGINAGWSITYSR
jgi:hypothetical protein